MVPAAAAASAPPLIVGSSTEKRKFIFRLFKFFQKMLWVSAEDATLALPADSGWVTKERKKSRKKTPKGKQQEPAAREEDTRRSWGRDTAGPTWGADAGGLLWAADTDGIDWAADAGAADWTVDTPGNDWTADTGGARWKGSTAMYSGPPKMSWSQIAKKGKPAKTP
ncbi:hypothetical protein FRC00_013674 [Tulasnella sp. 408]|nr:hypothetical protein FRC00_013674 [Tulasnella sp. 408]